MSGLTASEPAERIQLAERIQWDFSIDDREGLANAIERAMWAAAEADQPAADDRRGDTLDLLADTLRTAASLLADPINSNRLAGALRTQAPAKRAFFPAYLPDFQRQLELLAEVARVTHRVKARGKGSRRPKGLECAAEVLRDYYETLGRAFTNDEWAAGCEPVSEGPRFVVEILKWFAPDRKSEFREAIRSIIKNRKSDQRRAT